jgi:hypothetical protein
MAVCHYALLAFALVASAGCICTHSQPQSRGFKDGEIIEDWGVTQYPVSDKVLARLQLYSTSTNEDVRSALLKFNIDITKYGEAMIYQGGCSILLKSFDLQRKQFASLIDKLKNEE